MLEAGGTAPGRRHYSFRVVALTLAGLVIAAGLDAQDGRNSFAPPKLVRLKPSDAETRWVSISSAAKGTCAAQWDIPRLASAADAAWEAARAARPPDQPLEAWEDTAPVKEAVRANESLRAAQEAESQCVALELDRTPVVWRIPLHVAPFELSETIGVLEGRSDARNLAVFSFVPNHGDPVPVELDDVDYDEAILHTALAQRGGWVLLPRRPWPAPVWVRVSGDSEPLDVGIFYMGSTVEAVSVADGRIVELEPDSERGYLLLAFEGGQARIREEVASDMACEEEPAPEKRPRELRGARQFLLPMAALQDADGHLIIKAKYTKGC